MVKVITAKTGTRDKCAECGNPLVIYNRADWMKARGKEEEISTWDRQTSRMYIVALDTLDPRCVGLEGEYLHSPVPTTWCHELTESSEGFCLRAVKDEELHLCGTHSFHERKRMAAEEGRRGNWDEQRYIRNMAEAAVARLNELGLRTKPEYARYGDGWTGEVIVNPADLLNLLSERGLDQFDEEEE